MNPFLKYVLLQIPGWLAAAVLLVWFWPRTGWSPWVAVALYTSWVAKDFVLWPLLRVGYESNVPTGAAQLVGARGVTLGTVGEDGWIRVAGERWRARTMPGQPAIPPGTEVRVERASRLLLYVSRLD